MFVFEFRIRNNSDGSRKDKFVTIVKLIIVIGELKVVL